MEKRGFLSRNSSAILQGLVWTAVLLIPCSTIAMAGGDIVAVLSWTLPVAGWMMMFYINYFVYIPRVLFRKNTLRFALLNVFTALALIITLEGLEYIYQTYVAGITVSISFISFLVGVLFYGVIYLLVVLAATSIRSLRRNKQLEEDREHIHHEQTEMELMRLKSQLNPHFLFNSLNNISALSAIDPEAAQQAIDRLSAMLRYVLYDTAVPLVSLGAEMEFIDNYIALMSLRYTDRLTLLTKGSETLDGHVEVPPMLFISLIENAFKYGASSTRPSEITITWHQEDGRLSMHITNTLLTPDLSAAPAKVQPEKHGVGLRNLRRRLELIYPGDHLLTNGVTPSGLYEALITIPVSRPDA